MLDEDETVARMLEELADLEEIKGTDYKPRAYRRAARNIRHHPEALSVLHAEDRIGDVEGVGDAIETKIAQALETGSFDALDRLREEVGIDVRTLGRVRGLGSRKLATLHEELGIATLEDLEQAAEAGRIQQVAGFGAKTEAKIAEQIDRVRRASSRWLYAGLASSADSILEDLRAKPVFDRVELAGGLRRKVPLVEGLTLLASAGNEEAAIEAFTTLEENATLEAKSQRRATIQLAHGLPVELVLAEEPAFGAARIAHTGSTEHVQGLRALATEEGLTLTERGFTGDGQEPLEAASESAVYETLGLEPIAPELREGTGELAASAEGSLPDLVTLEDVRGDLQMHTEYSDGKTSVEAMARKADELGYEYILLTDHGPSLQVAGAPSLEELDEQAVEVEEVNRAGDVEATVLHGVEANIVEHGLDVPPDVCRELDLVVASLHDFVDDATERVLAALEDYPVDVFGHPTNRRLTEREGNPLDLEAIVETARGEDVAIEINAQVDRLDLPWPEVRRFKGEVEFVISTDAHSPRGMEQMVYGVHQARKGWLEPGDVANAQPLEELLRRLGRG